jgi:hypothetical protein
MILDRMKQAGWTPGPSASELQVADIEIELGVTFPPDYREFLMAAGGKPPKGAWRGLWHIDDLISLNTNLPLFRWFGGLVGFGNEGFTVYAFDFRRTSPSVVSLGLSSSDWADAVPEADSFEEWLEETLR